MPYSQTVAADTNSLTSTPALKSVSLYPPGGSSPANQTLPIVSRTQTGDITSGSSIVATGNIVLDSASTIELRSMDDITRAVQDNELTIRRYSDATGSRFDQIVHYPTFHEGGGTAGTITFGTDTITGNDLNVYGTTGGTIVLNAGDDYLWYGYGPESMRSLGRTLHRKNHRGMQPRAVSVDFSTATPEEITALQLLRQLVGQDEFRRYLKYGFVMVRGQSGLRYQIKRGRHVVDVWNERGRVDGICVYLAGSYPPTDDTITRMLMAERDELELWRRGNSRLGKGATLQDLQRLCRYRQPCAA